MNCRAKTQSGLVVLFILVFSGLASARELEWTELSSTLIEIQPFASHQGEVLSSYVPVIPTLMKGLLSWDPHKELNISTQNKDWREPSSKTSELIEDISAQFDVENAQYFRKVWFHLTPTLKVRGLLGLHDRLRPRPLVIFRMGIHGNVDELLAERFLAKIFYEDLGVNFLFLESLTSHAFLSQNKQVSIGGVEEGLHTFIILDDLLKSKNAIHSLISQVHLVGVSLGGPGVFLTSLLDQYNGHRVKSIMTFCPLINMQPTFAHHFQQGFSSAVVDLWNVRRLKSMKNIYPNEVAHSQWWKTIFDWTPRFTPAVFYALNKNRSKPILSIAQIEQLVPKIKWPDGLNHHLVSSDSLYELNDFWRYYAGVKTPHQMVVTLKDPLVLNELNSDLIMSGHQLGDFKYLKTTQLERGIHCGLAPVYQWNFIVKLIKEGLQL